MELILKHITRSEPEYKVGFVAEPSGGGDAHVSDRRVCSRGGPMLLKNGPLLCPGCDTSKGAR